MKKTALLLVLFLTLSCSNDDSVASSIVETEQPEVYMKVFGLSFEMVSGEMTYYALDYGTSEKDRIRVEITESVYTFYQNRLSEGNYRWIGEVDHE